MMEKYRKRYVLGMFWRWFWMGLNSWILTQTPRRNRPSNSGRNELEYVALRSHHRQSWNVLLRCLGTNLKATFRRYIESCTPPHKWWKSIGNDTFWACFDGGFGWDSIPGFWPKLQDAIGLRSGRNELEYVALRSHHRQSWNVLLRCLETNLKATFRGYMGKPILRQRFVGI